MTNKEKLENKINSNAVLWCCDNQFASHKDRGTAYVDGAQSLVPLLLEMVEVLEAVSKGHSVVKINYNYFNESSEETSMIKHDVLITKETEAARQALEKFERFINETKEK